MRNKLQQAGLVLFGLIAGIFISLNFSAIAQKEAAAPLPIEELRSFAHVFNAIKMGYVEPVEDKKLITHAISGMLTGLDPHSQYLDAHAFKDLQVNTQGEFGGLGIEVVQVLSGIAGAQGVDFDPSTDVFDVAANRREPPPIQKVFDYEAIVWSTRSNQRGLSGLRAVAQFVDPLPSRNQNTAKSYNYVNVYLANGGNLWINGFRPTRQLWPFESPLGHELDAVNVTNWDDPKEPHPPGIDSVGTISLLYAMGIEMFDVGSATDSRRTGRDHCCLGLNLKNETNS